MRRLTRQKSEDEELKIAGTQLAPGTKTTWRTKPAVEPAMSMTTTHRNLLS
jgi:hypothetical protein